MKRPFLSCLERLFTIYLFISLCCFQLILPFLPNIEEAITNPLAWIFFICQWLGYPKILFFTIAAGVLPQVLPISSLMTSATCLLQWG